MSYADLAAHKNPPIDQQMPKPDSSLSGQQPDSIDLHALFLDIEHLCADNEYIFRGETKQYRAVETGIRRMHAEQMEELGFSADQMQEATIDAARAYTSHTDTSIILSELQHFGANTNLLDFTEDYRVALYFACEAHPDKDGRLILCERDKYPSIRATFPQNRVIAQKSILIQPPQGLIEPDHIVEIPSYAKEQILSHLSRFSGISATSIYNDLHGFIRWQKIHDKAYISAAAVTGHLQRLSEATSENEKERIMSDIFEHTGNLFGAEAYRGLYYFTLASLDLLKNDYHAALDNAGRSIELGGEEVTGGYIRGVAQFLLHNLDEAEGELELALERSNEGTPDAVTAGIELYLSRIEELSRPEK